MSLTQDSGRFFFELALGLYAALACTPRRAIGPGFTRVMTAFVLASLVPAWFLARAEGGAAPERLGALAFGALVVATFALAGRLPVAADRLLVLVATGVGIASMLTAVHAGFGAAAAAAPTLLLVSSAGSMLVLGLVTGAMILGHWYLVTPDLAVAHLGRLTKLALAATYLKVGLLAATVCLLPDAFLASARAFGGAFGASDDGGGAPFQARLDFLWLLARVLIGLAGPAVLCHMTLATVKLKATQPATGILYAATVMVLMGELFAFVGERSFGVVL